MQNGSCWSNSITCVPADKCTLSLGCNVSAGGCSFSPVKCNDGNPCTDDSCDLTNGQCKYVNHTCKDGDPCTADSCDASTGNCVFTKISCVDTSACTTDSCNSNTPDDGRDPCVHTPINATGVCDDNNQCTDDTCDPATGCVNTAFDVKTRCQVSDGCTRPLCIPTFGCSSVPRSCIVNASGAGVEVVTNDTGIVTQNTSTSTTDCSYALCEANGTTFTCSVHIDTCAVLNTAEIVAAALGGKAIIGIVIGVVVGVALCGGGAYAAYNKYVVPEDAFSSVSPLYEASGFEKSSQIYEKLDESAL